MPFGLHQAINPCAIEWPAKADGAWVLKERRLFRVLYGLLTHYGLGCTRLQTRQKPKGPGPLAEVEHWRSKAAALGIVYEQLNLPMVTKLLELMSVKEVPSSTMLCSFDQSADLPQAAGYHG